MGNPAVVKQVGTGSAVWFCDWMQPFFSVGVSAIFSGGTGTGTISVTFDDPSTIDTNGISSPTWWPIVGPVSANATANFTTPVQAFQVALMTCTATSVLTVTFIQATFGR